MAGGSYSLTPKDVPVVQTKYRRICTPLPVPESIPILEELRTYEPVSMRGQPPIVWDKAHRVCVYDKWGNRWLDWSSGVLVANAGHGRREICDAVVAQARAGLLHNYCFPSEIRARLARRLVELSPSSIGKAFILTTGSEATECALKLARTHGLQTGGKDKITFVTFMNAFHGRTLGAQMCGGMPHLKEWIVNHDPNIVQVPFPDGFRVPDTSFETFEKALAEAGVEPDEVCGVLPETYQGFGASFAPPEFMQKLRRWTADHGALLIMDEVQACFGRTGKFWAFEHYGIEPDMICVGKGVTSSLPLSALLGRADVMDLYPPGSMTSTHTGNPICVAAALANIDLMESEGLVDNAAKIGDMLHGELNRLKDKHPDVVGDVHGKGMVAGVHCVKPGGIEPDGNLSFRVAERCMEKGLLLFTPVGPQGSVIKICPPLCTPEDAILEACGVLEEAFEEILTESGAAVAEEASA